MDQITEERQNSLEVGKFNYDLTCSRLIVKRENHKQYTRFSVSASTASHHEVNGKRKTEEADNYIIYSLSFNHLVF